MATPLTEQWVVRKDATSPWEYHDVPLGTKPRMVRKGFTALGRYGTEFEMHPVSALPRDKLDKIALPGDKIVYIYGGRSKSLEDGIVDSLGKRCLYVMHGATPERAHPALVGVRIPAYSGWRCRLTSGRYIKV